MKYIILFIFSLSFAFVSCQQKAAKSSTSELELESESESIDVKSVSYAIEKTEEQWKAELNDLEYKVLRKAGTERAFTGDLWDHKADGIYTCRACELPLFDSKTKFKSGTGWPSYYEPINGTCIGTDTDYNLGYARSEVHCSRCGGHMGHVFKDGPEPTGLRYCINSVSLDFVERDKAKP